MPHIYVNPWEWHDKGFEFAWRSPGGNAVGSTDLRSRPQQALAGGVPQGYGLFNYPSPQAGAALDLGDDMDGPTTPAQREELERLLGLSRNAIRSSSLRDVLREVLIAHGDPTGLTAAKPFRGILGREFKLSLGGFGYFVREPFSKTHPAYAQTRAVFQADYTRQREALDFVPIDQLERRLNAQRRWTRRTMSKLGLTDSDDLLPDPYKGDGSLPEATEYKDFFGRANGNLDGSTAGDGPDSSTWDEWIGTGYTVANNEARVAGNVGEDSARLDDDVSDDDQEASATIAGFILVSGGVFPGIITAQSGASANLDCYRWRGEKTTTGPDDNHNLSKKVEGATTDFADPADDLIAGEVLRLTWDGSTVECFIDAVLKATQSDSVHSGNRRGGFYVFHNGSTSNVSRWDAFEHKDADAGITASEMLAAMQQPITSMGEVQQAVPI